MTAFFVTATGTDIGKTYVTAGLVRHLRAKGEAVSALKPVASGFTMADAATSDAGQLLAALDEPVTPTSLDRIAPWRFAAPLSPDMAAAREGLSIDFDALIGVCRARIASRTGPLFIEGVGGVMVPLDDRHLVTDWMVALGLPLVLVTGSYLGTISHTLSALEAVVRRGLTVAALVVNESDTAPVGLDETAAAIRRFAGDTPIRTVHRGGAPDADFAALWARLASAAPAGGATAG
jgi:dethiobiotin synthetase